jgi:hypothetical protein
MITIDMKLVRWSASEGVRWMRRKAVTHVRFEFPQAGMTCIWFW